MLRCSGFFARLFFSFGFFLLAITSSAHAETPRRQLDFGKLPLAFEPNRGQTDAQVDYLSRGKGYTLFLTRGDAVLRLKANPSASKGDSVLRMRLKGSNRRPASSIHEALPGTSNYYLGNDPQQWRTNISQFAKVRYQGIYPGIDLIYYGTQDGRLEYDFVVAPGADPKRIALEFAGAERLRVSQEGDLVLHAGGREVRWQKPVVYQEIAGKRRGIDAKYVRRGNRVTFEVAKYDRTKPLVIDPVLVYSTYLGASVADKAYAVAVDAQGNAYITGMTASTNFPVTSGSFQSTFGGGGGFCLEDCGDVFVAKLNASGSALLYSTYIGGERVEFASGIKVDGSGAAYVVGQTYSSNFPITPNAYQNTCRDTGTVQPCSAAFVLKLNASGAALDWSTFLDGSHGEIASGVALDAVGNAYVTGWTLSVDFPVTVGAFQVVHASRAVGLGYQDGFVTKMDRDGGVVFSTFLGGRDIDLPASIAIDNAGNSYVTGQTRSTDFPATPGSYTPTGGTTICERNNCYQDGFLTKLNASGSSLIYSTYLGNGTGIDSPVDVAVDSAGQAHVIGFSQSSGIQATPGAFHGTGDGFILKMNASGSAPMFVARMPVTFAAIDLDTAGNSYVIATLPDYGVAPTTADAYQKTPQRVDAHLSQVDASGSKLLYASYFGGETTDIGSGIAVDGSGNAYVVGYTFSNAFPTTPGAYQRTLGAANHHDAFIAKFAFGSESEACAVPTSPGITLCSPQNGSTVTSPVRVQAAGHTGIVHLKVYVDHGERYSINSNRIDTSLALSAGSHLLVVQGWTSSGSVFKASATINVSSGGTTGCAPLATDPSVNICAPANGATANSPVHISARANSSQLPYHMKVYVDNQIAYSVNSDRIEADIPMAAGTRNVVVQAWDNIGRVFKASRTITVGGGTTPTTCNYPSAAGINVCSPVNGSTVGNPVRFWAAARSSSSSTPITAMRVYVDSTATYTISADRLDTTLNIPAGARRLTYVAWDSTGRSYTTVVNITVQ